MIFSALILTINLFAGDTWPFPVQRWIRTRGQALWSPSQLQLTLRMQSSADSHRETPARQGRPLAYVQAGPSYIWLQPRVRQIWIYVTFYTGWPVAPVSRHAPPNPEGLPPWRLSPLCKCKAVRHSLACNKGTLTKATRPYMRGELSTCIETVIMTQWHVIISQVTAMWAFSKSKRFPKSYKRSPKHNRMKNSAVSQNLKYQGQVPLPHLIMKNNIQVYPFIRRPVLL